MSWQPNGRYYTFSPEVIRACVPASSGVYGLFNFNYQLLIGESDNLQEALLRHRSDNDLQPRRYRPTGFTFQVYPADSRKRKAAELIEKFRPVRQPEAALTEPAPPTADPAENGLPLDELDRARIDLEEFSMHERESPPAARPRYYFERAQGAALMLLFTVCMAVSYLLGILTGENLQRQANRESEKTLAWMAATPSPEELGAVDLNDHKVAVNEVGGGLSVHIPGWTPTIMDPAVSTATLDKTPLLAASRPAGRATVQQAGTTVAGSLPAIPAVGNGETGKKWSVQISAAPARNVANTLMERLKGAGYDSYVVQAQVKGQTVYRVRVGPLDAQDEAESLRQSLAGPEGYRDAFLTHD
jgi:cell division septation protein DedD